MAFRCSYTRPRRPTGALATPENLALYDDKMSEYRIQCDTQRQAYFSDKNAQNQKDILQSRLDADAENQQRTFDFQREVNRDNLNFRKQQLAHDARVQADNLRFKEKTLGVEIQRAADQRNYNNRVLSLQREKNQWDQQQQLRVYEETKRRNQEHFDETKRQFDKTFAFNEKRALENDKVRIQAQAHAEAGARRQILSSLGFNDKRNRVSSPLESLLKRQRLNQTQRPRLRTV